MWHKGACGLVRTIPAMALAVGLLSACATQSDINELPDPYGDRSVCDHAPIGPVGIGRGGCYTARVVVRDGNAQRTATLAQAGRGQRFVLDAGRQIYEYFLVLPDGPTVPLGEFPQGGYVGEAAIYVQLGVTEDRVQRVGRRSYLYDRMLERVGDRYCVLYVMKPPFVGSIRDCTGERPVEGTVSYAPGTRTWRDAERAACDAAPPDVGRVLGQCEAERVRFTRLADGRLAYEVALRRSTARREFWTYRVVSDSSAPELIEIGAIDARWYEPDPQRSTFFYLY